MDSSLRRILAARRSDDAGFTLIEVIVAIALFAVVSTSTAAILINGLQTVRDNSDRVYAATLARSEIERVRSLDPTKITLGKKKQIYSSATGDYTITTESNWSAVGSTSSVCSDGDVGQAYLRVHVEVIGGRLKAPQIIDTLVVPKEKINTTDTGGILIKAVDQNGAPLQDVSITGTNTANTAEKFYVSTGNDGCIYLPGFANGTSWSISASRDRYVDTKNLTPSVSNTAVRKGETSRVLFTLGEASTLEIGPRLADYPIPAELNKVWISSTYMTGTTITVSKWPYVYTNLFPVTSGYEVAYGTCLGNNTGGITQRFDVQPGLTTRASLYGIELTLKGLPAGKTVQGVLTPATNSACGTGTTSIALGKPDQYGEIHATLPFGNWAFTPQGSTTKTTDVVASTTPVAVTLDWGIAATATPTPSASTATPTPTPTQSLVSPSPTPTSPGGGTSATPTPTPTPTPTVTLVATVPSRPLNLMVDTTTLDATWSAPTSNGGKAITGYTVKVWSAADAGNLLTTCSTGAGSMKCSLSGLSNGTTYYAEVLAQNSIGFGLPSTPRISFIPAVPTAPGAPTGVSVDPGKLQVTWKAPTETGGKPITGYVVQAWTAATGGTLASTCTTNGTLSCTLNGLTNGTKYYVEVAAVNPVGTGPTSSPRTSFTAAVPQVPTKPLSLKVTTSGSASWSAPASDGNSTITGYVVSAVRNGSVSGTCTTSGGLSCNISGLRSGRLYTFTVIARNSIGDSPASDPVDVTMK